MDKEVKARWLDALRSGKYKQGTGALKTSDGRYCCLGVLCTVEKPVEWDEARRTMYEGDLVLKGSWSGLSNNLLVRWDIPRGQMNDLIALNDDDIKSFNEIADYIERNM
jgi:hypothetical protein